MRTNGSISIFAELQLLSVGAAVRAVRTCSVRFCVRTEALRAQRLEVDGSRETHPEEMRGELRAEAEHQLCVSNQMNHHHRRSCRPGSVLGTRS